MILKLNNMTRLKIKIIGYVFILTIVSTISSPALYAMSERPCFVSFAKCVACFLLIANLLSEL